MLVGRYQYIGISFYLICIGVDHINIGYDHFGMGIGVGKISVSVFNWFVAIENIDSGIDYQQNIKQTPKNHEIQQQSLPPFISFSSIATASTS